MLAYTCRLQSLMMCLIELAEELVDVVYFDLHPHPVTFLYFSIDYTEEASTEKQAGDLLPPKQNPVY